MGENSTPTPVDDNPPEAVKGILGKKVNKPSKPEIAPYGYKKDGTPRKRPAFGGGRPKGYVAPKTLERLAMKRMLIQRVVKNTDKLFNAQLTKAIGETYLMVKITERGPKGGVARVYHEVVTSPSTIIDYLDGEANGSSISDDDHFYYITTKPADNMAIANIFDRAYGKPTEKVELGGKDEGDLEELSNEELDTRIDRYLEKRRGA